MYFGVFKSRAPIGRISDPEVASVIGGRLTPALTPDTVSVVGNVSLDDLPQVFPGY